MWQIAMPGAGAIRSVRGTPRLDRGGSSSVVRRLRRPVRHQARALHGLQHSTRPNVRVVTSGLFKSDLLVLGDQQTSDRNFRHRQISSDWFRYGHPLLKASKGDNCRSHHGTREGIHTSNKAFRQEKIASCRLDDGIFAQNGPDAGDCSPSLQGQGSVK
jgi:hypothetical protein